MKPSLDKNQLVGMGCSLIAHIFFGFSFIAVRLGATATSPLTLLSWRFFLAFVAMELCKRLGIFHIHLKGKSLKPLLLMVLFQPLLYFTAETLGIQMTSASESGTIIATIPLLTLLLMPALSREYPTRRQWISIAVSVCGVILVGATKWADATFNLLGYGLLFTAALSDAIFLNLTRRNPQFSGVEQSYIMFGFGALVFTIAALLEHSLKGTLQAFLLLPFQNLGFLLGCLYLSVGCSVIAFVLRNVGVAKLGPGRTGSFSGVTTLVSVISGVFLLGEDFSLLQGVGTLLVLLGVYGANSLPRGHRQVQIGGDPA